ncbi:MAG: acetylornithine/succinylornithine family transaminase [Christensenellales bacterium]|jgi:acetylornithine/N-succinyldiaminopimelate aminotransferase
MDFKEKDKKYIASTYARSGIEIVKGKGSTCYDSEGKEYIDFTSGIGVNSLGFANEGFAKAVYNQLLTMQHISNLYHNNVQIEVAEKLVKLAGMEKVFFANSGAEANECAIKAARKYAHIQKNKKKCIVTLNSSFHGRTITLLKANGQKSFHKYFNPFTPKIKNLEFNEDIFNLLPKDTGAIMAEIVQGEGGVNNLDAKLLKAVEEYCNKNDILFIVDEVQTGVGRCGSFLASQKLGLKPDIITLAKGLGGGLPVAACLFNKKTADVYAYGDHGTTFGGNPAVLSGVKYVLSNFEDSKFVDEINAKAKYIRDEISKFKNVEKLTGLGLMIGIKVKDKKGKDVRAACEKDGLLILTAKDNVRLLPPLNITYEEIDKGLQILKKNIEK